MDEEKKPEENDQDPKQDPKPKPPEKKEDPVVEMTIDKANSAAERLEKANVVYKDLVERAERVHIEQKLGGKSDGGLPPDTKEKEDKDISDNVLKQMGFESGKDLD